MTTWRPLRPPRIERDPKPLAESLDRVTRRLGGPSSSTAGAVFTDWEAVVGPDVAAHTRPISLHHGVLILAVDHPAWAAQLRFMTGEIISNITELTGAAEVASIQLRVAGEDARQGRRRGRRDSPDNP